MKVFVFVVLCCIAAVSCEHCYKAVDGACKGSDFSEESCTAVYGKGHEYKHHLQHYVHEHITRSMQYLMMASHYGTYFYSREGFEKLFRKLSDESWDDAIDLVKYITMRGYDVKLDEPKVNADYLAYLRESTQLSELRSLGKAVDIQKELAVRAHTIYNHTNQHDPETGSYIEGKFMHKHAETIRSLVGLTNDLAKLSQFEEKQPNVGLQNFIIDQYLKKSV